ncbi:quinol:electron acceptor oxidoreductase subunit ActD [Teichococcus aestuarii]|uniref:quinol:electron acceptor oxidoreductase subunit ActD n=1 Tax=Teichococcus aestuarii TaxID=568898 RepID=UPI00361E4E04
MSGLLLAEFRDPETLVAAARRARQAGLRGLDAHTPSPCPSWPRRWPCPAPACAP